MTALAFRRGTSPVASLLRLWRAFSAERKLQSAGLLMVAGLTAHVGLTVGRHIDELLAHKAAARTALYMDSFVEPLVQDLATKVSRNDAFDGHVVAHFDVEGDDDGDERVLGAPILEIYAPIRQTGTNRIV